MLKTPILLTFLVSCAFPAIAQIQKGPIDLDKRLAMIKHSNQLEEKALEAAEKKDWKLACSAYNERTLYRQKNKLDLFRPVPENEIKSISNIIHKTNVLVAKQNGMTNRTAEYFCGKAGKKAVLNTAEAVYEGVYIPINKKTSDDLILSNCRKEWGNDYRMIKYCVDEQVKARDYLGL
jgi:hypothetical protein